MITNIKKNIMGTVSFDGKFAGMRKAQDFIVYPMQDSGEIIHVQSDNRFGQIDLNTGQVTMSAPATVHAGSAWFLLCQIRRTCKTEMLPVEELQTLRQWIKSTGGLLVGASFLAKLPPCPPAVRAYNAACGRVGGFVGDRAGKAAGGRKGAAIRWNKSKANEPDKPA